MLGQGLSGMQVLPWQKLCIFGSQHCIFYPLLCSLLWGGKMGTACPSSSACTGHATGPWIGQARVPRHGTGWHSLQCHGEDQGSHPGHRTGWHSSDRGQAGMWSTRTEGQAEQNKVVPLLAATRRVVVREEPTRPCSQINFPDKAASLHHPGRAGRVPFTAVGKEMAILSAWAQKGIVSHCFPVNAGRVRGGSMVGEERRGQGQKRRPAELCQTWLWLLTDLCQEDRDRPICQPSSSQQPDPQLWLCPGTRALP